MLDNGAGPASLISEAEWSAGKALGPPSVGPRAPEAAILGNGDIAVSAQRTPDSGPLKGASQASWRLPGAPSLMGEKEKGKDGRRTSLNNRRAERWLFEI
jgi:hypothetical protein